MAIHPPKKALQPFTAAKGECEACEQLRPAPRRFAWLLFIRRAGATLVVEVKIFSSNHLVLF
jgi:hypothetical protein